MDKRFENQIIKALEARRWELYDQLALVGEALEKFHKPVLEAPALETFQPPPPEPVTQRTWPEEADARILECLNTDWKTTKQLQDKAGLSRHTMSSSLGRLLASGRVIKVNVDRVSYYRRPVESENTHVGEGGWGDGTPHTPQGPS